MGNKSSQKKNRQVAVQNKGGTHIVKMKWRGVRDLVSAGLAGITARWRGLMPRRESPGRRRWLAPPPAPRRR